MMSMTTWAWDSGEMPDIVFVHAARAPSEIIFRRRLEQFADRVPGLQLRFTVEENVRAAAPGGLGRVRAAIGRGRRNAGILADEHPGERAEARPEEDAGS